MHLHIPSCYCYFYALLFLFVCIAILYLLLFTCLYVYCCCLLLYLVHTKLYTPVVDFRTDSQLHYAISFLALLPNIMFFIPYLF